uniref:Chromosome 4 open reading frame 54 n=1 Tax=Amphiprion percula TaxID=161767 RepID=A0A3P8TBL3_AMPPE
MKTERSCVETSGTRRQVKDLLRKAAEDEAEKQDERKYVDLELVDLKTRIDGKKNQMSVLISNSGAGAVRATEPKQELETKQEEKKEDAKVVESGKDVTEDFGDRGERVITQQQVPKTDKNTQEAEELHSGGNHVRGRSESDDYEEDDDVSLVLSDDCVPCVTEDESHYITTHEIQLSELSDSEGDYDLGVGSSTSWDVEDDNQVYSFVDYASFDADGAVGEKAAAAVSTLSPAQMSIHLSIRTTSRAINDPSNIQEQENILYHARRSGDTSRYVFRGVDGKAETLCDRAKCFIAAPGRLHFGGKLRGKEVTEYSSGTSSAVSELDDADKEVRNLTAKAFKSLAYPYFDAINFSTSSESSASGHGLGINRWSTFVDLKYGNVNVSQGLDQSVVSHQNTDNRGYKGVALASIKPPTSKIFTLNGNPHGASTKKIELMGKFGQGHGGVIRLTETLNFRCNVKSGMSGGERRTNFAQNAAGSRSTDEVTNRLLSGQRRGAGKSPCKTMEGTHKKAIFASSLIKNVISKKMQFEQERKMERGEISEPHQAPSPCFTHQEGDGHRGKGSRELHRQSSKFSESSSDYAIMCADELGDFVDSDSCDTRSDSRRRDGAAPAPETNLEQANEAGIDTKKGALEASKSTLLRSQNSAFRCWKDEELEFQKDHKNDKTPEGKLPSGNDKEGEGDQDAAGGSKLTKMSHLFVPSIQLVSSGIKLRSDNTLYIADSRNVATSKSPEIKINLRSVRDNKTEPFGVSKLRAPNIGCNAASLIRTDDFKCQALAAALKGECSDKVPHFMVRDIRDNKGKLQTPIHQVRDVRKLVKSSYHFVSLDNNENKPSFAPAESHSEQKKQMSYRNPNSVSPIVIKCQSVNTNSNGKQSGNVELVNQEPCDADRSSPEGAKGAAVQRAAGRAPIGASEESIGLRIESRAASKRQEKISDATDKKPESKMANQVALEKLQAAVKTMEQLYVFEKNEWKRKNEPQPLIESHVLSLLASEEHGGPEEDGGARGPGIEKLIRRNSYPNADKTPPAASPGTDGLLRREDKDLFRALQTSSGREDRLVAKSVQAPSTTGSKNMFSLSSTLKASAAPKTSQQSAITQLPFSTKSFVPKSPRLPVSLKISQTRLSGAESREVDRVAQEFSSTSADNENYLTIPVKPHPSGSKPPPSAEKTSVYTFAPQSNPSTPSGHLGSVTRSQEDHNQTPKRSSIVMETRSPDIPSAAIYHSMPLGLPTNQPQVYCFSPAITPAPTLDPFQAMQRKMLLDPTTGSYYLVDTPVQPATKRLFDPETGQYVDVPMPQPPMTPVPMPISPLALSPGAYGHTYMIYPGFMSPSVIPARTLVQSQMSVQSEAESVEKTQPTEGMYMESPFYMATGKSPQVASGAQQQQQGGANRPPHGSSSIKQPVISITSQQGPRIIAPPSFDGTTMSFVVEHR